MGQKPELLLLRSDTKPDIDAVGFHHCGLMLVQAALAAKNAALLLRTQNGRRQKPGVCLATRSGDFLILGEFSPAGCHHGDHRDRECLVSVAHFSGLCCTIS